MEALPHLYLYLYFPLLACLAPRWLQCSPHQPASTFTRACAAGGVTTSLFPPPLAHRTVKDHVGLANALLVAAHVIGASVGKGPNPESESAAAAAAAQHALAGAVAPGGEAGLPTPSLAAGRPKRARSGAAAAAAAGEASSAPAAPAAAPSQPFHATLAQAFQGRQPGLLAPLAGGLAEGSAQGAMQQQLHIQQMLLQQQVQAEQQQQQQQQEQQRVPLTLQQQVNYLSLMQQLQTMRQLMPAGTQFTAVTMPPATQAPAPAPMPAAGALSGWAMAAPLPLPQPQQQPLPHMPGMGLPGGGTWQMPGLPRVMPGLGMPYLHPGPGAGPGYGGLGVTAGGSSSTAPQQGPYPGMVLPGMGPGAAPLGAMPQAGASGASTGAFPDQQYGQQYFQQYGQQNEQQYTPPGEQAAGGEYAQVPGAPPAQPAGAADESSGEHDQWEEKQVGGAGTPGPASATDQLPSLLRHACGKSGARRAAGSLYRGLQAPGQKRARAEGEIGSWAGTLPAQGGGAV